MLKTLLLGLVMNAAAERNVVQRCEAVWDLTLALPGESYSGSWCEGAVAAVTLGPDPEDQLVGTLQIEQGKLRLELARDSAPEQPLWLGLELVSATTAQPLKSTQAGAAKATLQLKRRDGDAVYLYMDIDQPLDQIMRSITRETGVKLGGAALPSTKMGFKFAAIDVNQVIQLLADVSELQTTFHSDGSMVLVSAPSKAEQAHNARAEAIIALAADSKLVDARQQAELALAEAQRAFGKVDRRTADSLALMAEIDLEAQDWKQAETLLRESLAIREQVLAPLDPDIEQSNNLLARTLAGQGRNEEAMRFMARGIASAEQAAKAGLHGPNAPRWPDLVAALILQAKLYVGADNLPAAKQSLDRARNAIETYGTGLAQADALLDLRGAIERRGQTNDDSELESLAASAYAIARKNLPEGDPRLVKYLLAAAHGWFDNQKAAEPLLLEALQLLDATPNANALQLARAAGTLAKIYERSDRLPLAEKMYRRVLAVRDPDVQKFLNVRLDLSDNLLQQGKCAEALELYGTVSDPTSVNSALFGKLSAVRCLLDAAVAEADLGDIADVWAQTVSVRVAALGEAHANTVSARQELRAAQRAAGRAAPAAALKPNSAEPGSLNPGTQATAREIKDYIESAASYTLHGELTRFAYDATVKTWFTSKDPKLASKAAALLELDAELFVEAKVPANALQSLQMALALRTRALGATHAHTKRTAARLAELRRT